MINRREFVRNSILCASGATIMSKDELAPNIFDKRNKIKGYRKLGNTDFKVSDISIGHVYDEGVLRAALKAGINCIDTSEAYFQGNHEKLIGSVISEFNRKDLFITSKVFHTNLVSKEDIISRVESSLKRLNTSYLDCFMIHQVGESSLVKNEYFHQAASELKENGKIHHVGISCHGSSFLNPALESLQDILMAAIDDGRFDMLFFAYNFIENEEAEKILKVCHQKKIGTFIMKSNPVFAYNQIKQVLKEWEEKGQYVDWFKKVLELYQKKLSKAEDFFKNNNLNENDLQLAGTKFVLNNPYVNTVVNSILNYNELEAILEASGKKTKNYELGVLDRYKETFGFLNCRIGCDKCHSSCPNQVPINDIMRFNYYFHVKKQEKMAMEAYASLKGSNANNCSRCAGYCMRSCPYQVMVQPLLEIAHKKLTIHDGLVV